jgi:transcription elongation GreA/GreB family factor
VVKTPLGNFFMAVFVGKIEVEGESYFAISPASPIGQAMASAREGDVISFRGKEYKLEQLF